MTQDEINKSFLIWYKSNFISFWSLLEAIIWYCTYHIHNKADSEYFAKKITKLKRKLENYYGRGD